jgi:hypothetical protein
MKWAAIGCIAGIGMIVMGCGGGPVDSEVEAEVLSINGHIADGKTIGEVLKLNSVPKDDKIRIGTKFKIGNHLFLQDMRLNHAMLANLKNRKKVNIDVRLREDGEMEFRISGYHVGSANVSLDLHRKLREIMEWD